HTVVKLNGRRCPCGRRGCLEAYAGRAALQARAQRLRDKGVKTDLFRLAEHRGGRLTSGVWERALHGGDRLARKLIEEAIAAIGAGIGSAVNFLDPDAVIIGGGLGSRLGPAYLERIVEAVEPHLFVADRPPALSVSSLGDLGGAIGASLLVADGA